MVNTDYVILITRLLGVIVIDFATLYQKMLLPLFFILFNVFNLFLAIKKC